jgi:predicted RNase H-like HicB family nuclease
MSRKASVVIEKDEHGFYACCPELRDVSRRELLLRRRLPIKEPIEIYLQTYPDSERDLLLSRESLTTAIEVDVS